MALVRPGQCSVDLLLLLVVVAVDLLPLDLLLVDLLMVLMERVVV